MANDSDRVGDALSILGAALVGAAIGASVALLLAPKPGPELREDLKKTASQAGERLSDAGHTIADKVKQTAGSLGQRGEATAEQETETVAAEE